MSEFQIKRATRTGIKPLIVFYSESGCGKTYTAILLARGMVGPKGKIVVIDSESGRASLYADIPEFGGFDTIDLQSPFTPARYIGAYEAAIADKADIVIYDSGSHEWEGTGGVNDMAMENESRSGRPGLHNWKTPKFEHAKFIASLVRSSVPVIVCLRAKFKTRQSKGTKEMFESGMIRKDEIGKTLITKDPFTSPIQSEDFIFEATCHGEIMPDHSLRLTKWSHPSLKACFPDNAPIEKKHGELIAKWCVGESVRQPTEQPAQSSDLKTAKKKLWDLTKSIHGESMVKLQQWLVDECIIAPDVNLSSMNLDAVNAAIHKAEQKLKGSSK